MVPRPPATLSGIEQRQPVVGCARYHRCHDDPCGIWGLPCRPSNEPRKRLDSGKTHDSGKAVMSPRRLPWWVRDSGLPFRSLALATIVARLARTSVQRLLAESDDARVTFAVGSGRRPMDVERPVDHFEAPDGRKLVADSRLGQIAKETSKNGWLRLRSDQTTGQVELLCLPWGVDLAGFGRARSRPLHRNAEVV